MNRHEVHTADDIDLRAKRLLVVMCSVLIALGVALLALAGVTRRFSFPTFEGVIAILMGTFGILLFQTYRRGSRLSWTLIALLALLAIVFIGSALIYAFAFGG